MKTVTTDTALKPLLILNLNSNFNEDSAEESPGVNNRETDSKKKSTDDNKNMGFTQDDADKKPLSFNEEKIKEVARALELLEKKTNVEETSRKGEEDAVLNNANSVEEREQSTDVEQIEIKDEPNSLVDGKDEFTIDSSEIKEVKPRLDVKSLEKELKRVKSRKRFIKLVASTANGLIVTAAVAVLVAMLWLPVLQIYGSSMTPTLEEGDIVITVKDSGFETGDLVAFYYGNKLLVKRCIAGPSDWIDINEDGEVKVNGKKLNEPYISEKSLGECDIDFPYQVPEEHWFLMGDHRKTSVDSRSNTIGAVSKEQIVGKVIMRIWPLDKITWSL